MKELKIIIIQNGYDSFGKEFNAFLDEKGHDKGNINFGNLIQLSIDAILFLYEEEKRARQSEQRTFLENHVIPHPDCVKKK